MVVLHPFPPFRSCQRNRSTASENGKNAPIHIVIDSTGLKVYGEGEWKVKIHGKSKRRAWRKLHLGVNPFTREVEAEELTEAFADDAKQVEGLLAQIDQEIDCAACDGAYDEHKIHALLQERGARGSFPQAGMPESRNEEMRQGRRYHETTSCEPSALSVAQAGRSRAAITCVHLRRMPCTVRRPSLAPTCGVDALRTRRQRRESAVGQ